MKQKAFHTFLKSWLDSVLGKPQIFKITFDLDFVSGNAIDGTVGGVLTTVNFDTDQETTINALAVEIQNQDSIFKAEVTGTREITCVVNGNGLVLGLKNLLVTGGAQQATATFTDTQDPVAVTSYLAFQRGTKAAVGQSGKFYPYATYDILTSTQIGDDQDQGPADDNGLWNFGGQRRVPVRVQYFGPYAVEALEQARQSLTKPTIRQLFRNNDISVHEKGSVQNLSSMLETLWEERATIDFAFGMAENYQDDVGLIEKVQLTGTITGGNETVTVGPVILQPKP